MKITYFGTGAGAGIPEIFCSCRVCNNAREMGGKDIRTRSGALVDGVMAIDFSVDTFAHSAFYGMDMRRVRDIVITHAHHDHFMCDDIFSRPQGLDSPIRFYSSEKGLSGLKRKIEILEERYANGKKRPENFSVIPETLGVFEQRKILGYTVTALPANHAKGIDAMIFVIEKNGKSVLWAHDTGLLPEETEEWIRASGICFDMISLDCTLKRGEPITASHMDLDRCIETAERLRESGNANGNTRIIISHIGHLVERTHAELCAETAEWGIEVAYDGMTVEI